MNTTQRNHDEEEVKQFICSTLQIQLPKGSLQDILKDGILLCEYVYSKDRVKKKEDDRG